MKKMRRIAALLCLALLACCLAGCGSGGDAPKADGAAQNEKDEGAKDLGYNLWVNTSTFFRGISGVTELAAPICVVVKKGGAYEFLQDEALPIAAPDAAKAALLVEATARKGDDGEPDGTYNCEVTYGTTDGSLSVVIGRDIVLEKDQSPAEMLQARYTFVEGDATLLAKIADYEAQLAGRDYLTAIKACENDYGSASYTINAADIAEPMVYMKDAAYVCEPVPGNDLYSAPAEKGQFVPSHESYANGYQRPEISGDVTLAVTGIGKRPDDSGDTDYTLEEAEAMMATLPETFCFSEIIGMKPYGTYSSKSSGDSFTAYSYVMRVSVIGMDGTLRGCCELLFDAPDDPLGLNAQIIALSLSVDKNGDVVFPWAYKSELWKW